MFDDLVIAMNLDYKGLEGGINKVLGGLLNSLKNVETGKMDWDKIMNLKYFSQINWNTIIQKLFTPANLVAFFSAMAAAGIVSSVQAQTAGAAAGGTTGQTTPQDIATFGAQGLQLASQLGTAAGSASDYSTALATINAELTSLGISTSNTLPITTELIQAFSNSGGTIQSDLIPFMNELQASGADTSDQIEQLISNLNASAESAGGVFGSDPLSTILSQMLPLTVAAHTAGVNFDNLNTQIVSFGQQAAISVTGAEGNIKDLTDAYSGDATVLSTIFGDTSAKELASQTNAKGVNAILDTMVGKLAGIASSAYPSVMAAAYGVNLASVQGSLLIKGQGDLIDANTTKLTNMSGSAGMASVQTEFDNLDTVTRDMSELWPTIQGTLNGIIPPAALQTVLKYLDDILSNKAALITLGTIIAAIGVGSTIAAISKVAAIVAGVGAAAGVGAGAGAGAAAVGTGETVLSGASEGFEVGTPGIIEAAGATEVAATSILGILAGPVVAGTVLAGFLAAYYMTPGAGSINNNPNSTVQTAPGVNNLTITWEGLPSGVTPVVTANPLNPMSISSIVASGISNAKNN